MQLSDNIIYDYSNKHSHDNFNPLTIDIVVTLLNIDNAHKITVIGVR